MPTLQEIIERRKKATIPEVSKTIIEKPEIKKVQKPKTKEVKTITTPKTPEEFKKLTIDELRAYFIVICKESPKHDSKQTKEVLIKKIIKRLEDSI